MLGTYSDGELSVIEDFLRRATDVGRAQARRLLSAPS